MDRKTIRLFTKEETTSYETYLIPYNSEIITDNNNNSVNKISLQQQQQQQKFSSNNGNNNNKIQVINSWTGKPLKKGKYNFVLTMDVVDNEDPQQQQQQKKKSQSKLLLFPDHDKRKHTSPYPGAVPVWHAGEFWIQDNENNDNDGGTTTTSTINGSSTSSTSTHTTRSTIRETTNMHDTYISQISASSGHYVPTKNHVRWFQHWIKLVLIILVGVAVVAVVLTSIIIC